MYSIFYCIGAIVPFKAGNSHCDDGSRLRPRWTAAHSWGEDLSGETGEKKEDMVDLTGTKGSPKAVLLVVIDHYIVLMMMMIMLMMMYDDVDDEDDDEDEDAWG